MIRLSEFRERRVFVNRVGQEHVLVTPAERDAFIDIVHAANAIMPLLPLLHRQALMKYLSLFDFS